MKITIITIALAGMSQIVCAQTADQHIVGSLGGSFSNSNLQVDYTAGEAITQTLSTANYIVTQGFQQPFDGLAALHEIEASGMLSIYPNPASSEVHVLLNNVNTLEGQTEIEILHMNGALALREIVTVSNATDQIRIGLEDLKAGQYLLRIVNDADFIEPITFTKL